ncbi:MAG TPA: glycosyl hydrolase family 28-related protein [Parafilimonas sp.]|nr:glycosyl hydrolase family 28-related protein [Parafilimonas sp.]
MKALCFFTILFVAVSSTLSAQVIPDSLRADWSHAGYDGTIPDTSFIINVKNFGAYGDGVHNDYNAIVNAVSSSSVFRVIYFPAGNYLIKSSIILPGNIVFRGDGITSNLIFDLSASGEKDAIVISATQTNTFVNIISGYSKGSNVLKLKNTAGFTAGGFAEIREVNGAWNTVPVYWATYCVGQIIKIKAVNGNNITTEPALRIDYTDTLHPEIRPVNLKTNVGIECLKITRLDTIVNNKHGYNINFSYAGNCWVRGIESGKSQASHIMLASSKNILISGCYFHDAFAYDGTSTAGYGVTMIQHNSDCKVENGIFKHLRHSMVAKQGANGNVFAYNYSFDPFRSEDPHDAGGDMLLHGHYPFANLFEGNIGQSIVVDDTWGPAGPYNTFFRNRSDLYGIILFDQSVNSDRQNIVGNEITNTDSSKGNYYLQPDHHFTYNNNVKGTIEPANTNVLNDKSYYLTGKPYFWNVSSLWPSIGGSNVLNSGTIPAKERYLFNQNKTICLEAPPAALQIFIGADSIQCNGGISKITVSATGGKEPYQGIGEYYKPAGNYTFVVSDAFGYPDSAKITLGQPDPVTAVINTTASQTCKLSGLITVANTTGGHRPYYFSLDGMNYTPDSIFKNIASGTYTTRIKDASGCIDSIKDITVGSVPTIAITAKTTIAGNCTNDGTITIKRTGGSAPFQYSINNNNYVSTNVFTGLAPGIYTAWVKDKKACVDSLRNITVSQAAPLNISIKKVNVSCKDGRDGKITIKAGGGIKPYLYSLDSMNYALNNVFANLSPGAYKCWVKDSKGCIAVATTIINNGKVACPPGISLNTINDQLNYKLAIPVSSNPSTQKFVLKIKSSGEMPKQFTVANVYRITPRDHRKNKRAGSS